MAKGRAEPPPAFYSLRYCFVLLCREVTLANLTIAGPFQGATLANPQGLPSPAHVALLQCSGDHSNPKTAGEHDPPVPGLGPHAAGTRSHAT